MSDLIEHVDHPSPQDLLLLSALSGGSAPPMPLGRYLDLVRGLPLPTDGQIEAFARYVSTAKSWYRHLPFTPPGAAFQFYLHPCAGTDRLLFDNGEVRYRERTEDGSPGHHSWMLTNEYRARFGFLAFSFQALSGVFLSEDVDGESVLVDPNPGMPLLHTTPDSAFRPPVEILGVGRCALTAVVHRDLDPDLLLNHIVRRAARHGWPAASGWSGNWRAIIERCRELSYKQRADDERTRATHEDARLGALLVEQREVHLAEMVATIRAVRQLIEARQA
jgi:hypothetical protein